MTRFEQDRFRNKTICFRASPEEVHLLNARIKTSCLPKGDFILKTTLYGEINIEFGKYHSERLAVEIKRLREQIAVLLEANQEFSEEMFFVLNECKYLLTELKNRQVV